MAKSFLLISSVGFLSASSAIASSHGAFHRHLPLPLHPNPISMALTEQQQHQHQHQHQQQLQFDLPSFLKSKTHSISLALDHAIPVLQPVSIYESMRYSIFADSSRVCPLLCISACELVGGSEDLAMPTACALEMLHTASLIHDDLPCMDDDELRRGKAANHKVFGEDLAILAGDALYALGVEHVARATKGTSADRLLRVISELGKAVGSQGMVAGQYLELAVAGTQHVSFEDLQGIHLRKTAALAECATVCGALLGGAEEEQSENLRQYGRALGLLYEVVEDVIDAKQSAKSSRDSSETEKSTYSRLLGLEKCKELAEQLQSRAKEHLSSFDKQSAMPLICFVDHLAKRM